MWSEDEVTHFDFLVDVTNGQPLTGYRVIITLEQIHVELNQNG